MLAKDVMICLTCNEADLKMSQNFFYLKTAFLVSNLLKELWLVKNGSSFYFSDERMKDFALLCNLWSRYLPWE